MKNRLCCLSAFMLLACGEPAPQSPELLAVESLTFDPLRVSKTKTGERLQEPLIVRAWDANGGPLSGVRVMIDVFGDANVWSSNTLLGSNGIAETTTDGSIAIELTPRTAGPFKVRASLPDAFSLRDSVTLDVTASILLSDFEYLGIGFSGSSTLPIGTDIEWMCVCDTLWTVTSVDAPAGATPFDSGVLDPEDSFRYTPDVVGEYRFEDSIRSLESSISVTAPGT